jgi:metabolite-proton symporter
MPALASTTEAAAPASGAWGVRRIAVAALIGTSIEWYDFFIYGLAAALVFAPQFFPKASPVAGTLAALSTFAVGFLARPIGGAIVGHFGDRIGRRPMLVVTLLLMGGASTLIGLLPTYAQIGVAAPVLLVTLRLLQGLAVGGEWGGAVLMSTEHAPSGRRGWYGSFVQLGIPMGLVTSNLVFLLVSLSTSTEQFASWGWRIPFLLSAALVLVGLYVRLRVDETPEFAAHKARGATLRVPIAQVLRQHWRTVLLGLLIPMGTTGLGYVSLVFLLSYGAGTLGMNRNVLLVIVMVASMLEIPAALLAARWSDRVERSRVILWGGAATLVAAALFFPLVDTRSPILVGLAVLAVRFGLASMYGPVAALLAESFPTTVGYSGASLTYQLGSIAGGGLSPIMATILVASSAGSAAVSGYLVALIALSMLGAAGIRRLNRAGGARPTRS